MKILLIMSIISVGFCFNSDAQAPKGFRKGTITLEDNSVLTGYIKEHFQRYACLAFIPEKGGRRKIYEGSQLRTVSIDSLNFICLKGDFFHVISEGRLCLLQKSSDATNVPSYNGTEAIFVSGTVGQRDDYYLYSRNQNQLLLITRKNYREVISEAFAGYPKTNETAGDAYDISQIRSAVIAFNTNHNN
jgi:hypothetical protein